MQILLYDKLKQRLHEDLARFLEAIYPVTRLESYQDIKEFKKKLLQPKTTPVVAVIVPLDSDDLEQLQSIDFLLNDIKIILVLPDGQEETIRRGHLLRPRFLTFMDGQSSSVIEVLKKMLSPNKRPYQNILQPIHGQLN